MRAAMTAPISASIASLVAVVSSAIASITPAARRRRAAITRTVVPIARARAAVISAAAIDDHARLNNWSAIAITGFVAWRGGLVTSGVA